MDRSIFMTGFPGFIGSKVVSLLLDKDNSINQGDNILIKALVQPAFSDAATAFIAQLPAEARKRISIVEGDLCERRFWLNDDTYSLLLNEVNEVIHLAALYHLGVKKGPAINVNVIGTKNVILFNQDIKNLRIFNHISSIVFSGKREGVILERELEHEAGFNNQYEATKYWSEMLVNNYVDILPTIVFRPGVVVGDSKTGEINKYDGPYYTIKSYLAAERLPGFLMPVYSETNYAPFHIVPVDFIAKAIVHISKQPDAVGKTFHLVDRFPLASHELFNYIHKKIFKTKGFSLPGWMLHLMANLPSWLSVGAMNGIAYLDQTTIYDARNTYDFLKDSGIDCPRVYDYIDNMIDFVRSHPEIPMVM